jgi:hypothetical protein
MSIVDSLLIPFRLFDSRGVEIKGVKDFDLINKVATIYGKIELSDKSIRVATKLKKSSNFYEFVTFKCHLPDCKPYEERSGKEIVL